MTPPPRPSSADGEEPSDDRGVEKRAFATAFREITERLGPDGGGSVVTSFKLPKLTRTRLGVAVMLEDGYSSMNDIVVAALDEWLDRHGYPTG